MLDSETHQLPLVEDVRAARSGGPDGTGLVVVEGVWGAVAGGPPPVLIVDDGARRHTLAALDGPPPDDPMAFKATFAVPAELIDLLGDGLALGVGRTEVPLALAEPEEHDAAGPWLQGPPLIARRLSPEAGEGDAAPAASAAPPRRVDRGEPAASAPSGGSIAAAIMRMTERAVPEPSPPPTVSGIVVERSVIAERRAKRSEQLAAVMERRARGAEGTAHELTARIRALEERLAEVLVERDELAAELALQRAAVAQAQGARIQAEARLADLLDREESAPAPDHESSAGRGLPGLEEAARAMREQEPLRSAPDTGADPDRFADALAKLRARREEIAAVVAPHAGSEVAPPAAPPLREHVIPYVISAEHPRTPWMAAAIAALDERDRRSAALLVAGLLPDQARTARRPLVYDLDLEGLGPLRVELEPGREGRVLPRLEPSPDASFVLAGTPAELATLAGGDAPLWPRGLRVGGARRFFLPLARLSRTRRRAATLADVVAGEIELDPGLVVRALACAVPPAWTAGHAFAVTVSIAGRDTCRVLVEDGAPLHVLSVDEAGRRSGIVAATAAHGPAPEGAVGGGDAVLGTSERGAIPLLAQAEPPADEEPATVLGDLAAATTLLAWFDRVQGLHPRA